MEYLKQQCIANTILLSSHTNVTSNLDVVIVWLNNYDNLILQSLLFFTLNIYNLKPEIVANSKRYYSKAEKLIKFLIKYQNMYINFIFCHIIIGSFNRKYKF